MKPIIDYKKVAEFCKLAYPEIAEKVLSIGNSVLENRFIFDLPWDMERTEEAVQFQDEVDWNYKLNGDSEFLYQLNRHHFFRHLGQCYYLTGKDMYLQKLKALWLDFLESVPYTRGNTPYRSLEVGMRAVNWLSTLQMLEGTGYLDADFHQKIDDCLKEHVRILKEAHTAFHVSSNWGMIQDSGLFLLGAYFRDKSILDLAYARLEQQAALQIFADGVHWEQSAGYHNAVLFAFSDVIATANRIDYSLSDAFRKRFYDMAMVNLKWRRPDGCQPLLGDSDDNDLKESLTRSALLLENGTLKYFALPELDWYSAFFFGMEGIERYRSIQPTAPDFLSVQLSHSGQCIYRSSWEKDADYLHFMNGKTGGGHAHADKLHVSLCLDGRDVLVDAGRHTYKNTKERHFIKSTAAHNTTILAGKPFLKPIDAWQVTKLAPSVGNTFLETEQYAWIEGGHLGYLSKKSYFSRAVLILKPDIYVFFDTFFAHGRHRYKNYLHFWPNGKAELSKHKITYKDEKGAVGCYLLGASLKIQSIASVYSAHYNAATQNPAFEISFAGQGRTSLTTVILKETDKNRKQSVEEVSAYLGLGKVLLPSSVAKGYVIKQGDDTYTICVAYREMRDAFLCNNKFALGKITVYKNDTLLFTIG